MKHVIKHDLDQPTAKRAMDAAFDVYKTRFSDYNPQVAWQGDTRATISFRAKGVSIEGNIELHEREIHVELKVPFLLRPFTGKAVAVVEETVQEWVAKAKAGEV